MLTWYAGFPLNGKGFSKGCGCSTSHQGNRIDRLGSGEMKEECKSICYLIYPLEDLVKSDILYSGVKFAQTSQEQEYPSYKRKQDQSLECPTSWFGHLTVRLRVGN